MASKPSRQDASTQLAQAAAPERETQFDDDRTRMVVGRIKQMHLDDMPSVAYHGASIQNWLQRFLSDVVYFARWLAVTWWAVFTSLPNYVLDPFGAATVLGFATGSTVVLSIMLVVSAITRTSLVQWIWDQISDKNEGIGLANIGYPQIFDSLEPKIRETAYKVMSSPLDEFSQPSNGSIRTFDLEVSKMLFCCAALVYERDGDQVAAASKKTVRVTPHTQKDTATGATLRTTSGALNPDGQAVMNHLEGADKTILKYAHQWGLNYVSLSELGTNTSPVCGAFWSSHHNFIILAFKGTNPVEFKEWALDFTLQYTEGGAWLPGFGKVHSGFYNSIFPGDIRRAQGIFPYEEIRTRVREIAELLVDNSSDGHVNLYVTGHSLGAALASFVYARAAASPEDFGTEDRKDLVRVRDAYTFGTPIFGDPECISAFGNIVHRNLDRPISLWRVTNRHDAVATMLPEGGDYEILSHISPTSQFHYAHVGQEIQMRHFWNRTGTGPGTMLSKGSRVKTITHLGGSGVGPDVELSPLIKLLENTPILSRMVTHMPSSYWARLTKVEAEENLPWFSREPVLISL